MLSCSITGILENRQTRGSNGSLTGSWRDVTRTPCFQPAFSSSVPAWKGPSLRVMSDARIFQNAQVSRRIWVAVLEWHSACLLSSPLHTDTEESHFPNFPFLWSFFPYKDTLCLHPEFSFCDLKVMREDFNFTEGELVEIKARRETGFEGEPGC